jgi:AraC-like DNA-binding protein
VGITPGKLAKVSRFFHIVNAIMQKNANATEIIQRFEYYDRQHFSKDFKAFTSKTPSEFFVSVPEVFTKYAEQYRASLPDNKSKDFLDN